MHENSSRAVISSRNLKVASTLGCAFAWCRAGLPKTPRDSWTFVKTYWPESLESLFSTHWHPRNLTAKGMGKILQRSSFWSRNCLCIDCSPSLVSCIRPRCKTFLCESACLGFLHLIYWRVFVDTYAGRNSLSCKSCGKEHVKVWNDPHPPTLEDEADTTHEQPSAKRRRMSNDSPRATQEENGFVRNIISVLCILCRREHWLKEKKTCACLYTKA